MPLYPPNSSHLEHYTVIERTAKISTSEITIVSMQTAVKRQRRTIGSCSATDGLLVWICKWIRLFISVMLNAAVTMLASMGLGYCESADERFAPLLLLGSAPYLTLISFSSLWFAWDTWRYINLFWLTDWLFFLYIVVLSRGRSSGRMKKVWNFQLKNAGFYVHFIAKTGWKLSKGVQLLQPPHHHVWNNCLNSYQVHLPSVNAFKKSLGHLVF